MSVSFIQELKILRYLRKNVKVRDPSDITFFNGISSLFYICKRVSVKHILTFDIFTCTPCASHTYILHNGSLNKLSRILESKRHEFQSRRTPLPWLCCPVGGNCSEYVMIFIINRLMV